MTEEPRPGLDASVTMDEAAQEPLVAAPAPRRLSFLVALAWVLLGGAAAQVLGGLVAVLARTGLAGARAPAEALDGVAVFIPAMLASSAALIALAFLAPALAGVPIAHALGLRPAKATTYVAAAIGTIMLGPTADHVITAMQEAFPGLSLGVLPRLNDLIEELPLWIAWPAFALLPGLSEELVFRGLLQRAAPPGWRAIVISALAFALFHVDPQHAAGVLPLGLFLSWVASRAGTLVTIAAHVANNSAAIAALHVSALAVGHDQPEPMPWQWLPISLTVVAGCAAVIARDTLPDRG
jgi:membrane protease YdiL (CAAX protease family)